MARLPGLRGILPVGLRPKPWDHQDVSPEAYKQRALEAAVEDLNSHSEIAARNRSWRAAAAGALARAGCPVPAEAVAGCTEIWIQGLGPSRCQRPKFCLDCAARNAYVAWVLDRPRLISRSPSTGLYEIRSEKSHRTTFAWARTVRGYRRFWLPRDRTYLWIIIATAPEAVEAVLGPTVPVAGTDLHDLYLEQVAQMRELGPEAAVAVGLDAGRIRTIQGGGLLAGRLKLPRRRRKRRRRGAPSQDNFAGAKRS